MVTALAHEVYRAQFPVDHHFFHSAPFIDTVRHKIDDVRFLAHDGIGLVVGLRDGYLLSPFSAPFGGVHWVGEFPNIARMTTFFKELQSYCAQEHLQGFRMVLPPDCYGVSYNATILAAADAAGVSCETPEITSWVSLASYDGKFTARSANKAVRLAEKSGLLFSVASDEVTKRRCYDIIQENRARQGRPIYMTFDDVVGMEEAIDVGYFFVSHNETPLAAAIVYQLSPAVVYALFWGDTETGRPLRSMDYLIHHLYRHYKSCGVELIDLGISTEEGVVNEGLLSFKERHNAVSAARQTLIWEL